MNRPLNKTFLACALAVAWGAALAAGPATVTVKKEADGTLVITNIENAAGTDAGAAKAEPAARPVPAIPSADEGLPRTEAPQAPVTRVEAPGGEGEAVDREKEEESAKGKEKGKEQAGEPSRLESSGMGAGPQHGSGDGGFMGSGIGPGPGIGGGAVMSGDGGAVQEGGGTPSPGDRRPAPGPAPTAVTGPTARPATDMAVPSTADTKSTAAQERYRDTMLQEAGLSANPKNPASVRRYLMMDRNAYQNRSR